MDRNLRRLIELTVTIVLILGFCANVMAKNKYEKEIDIEASAVKLVQEVQRGGYDVVTTQELKKWLDSGKEMVIVDAMPYKAYKKIHIPTARQFLFPIPEMKTWDASETDQKSTADYEALLGSDKNKVVVVYCGFVKCTRSHNAAVWAKKLGYNHVYRYPGGIFAWQGADYKTDKVK